MLTFFFDRADDFPEIRQFVRDMDAQYGLHIQNMHGDFKAGVEHLVHAQGIKAIYLGTRRCSSSIASHTSPDTALPQRCSTFWVKFSLQGCHRARKFWPCEPALMRIRYGSRNFIMEQRWENGAAGAIRMLAARMSSAPAAQAGLLSCG
jgi:hypothetical protein